MSRRRQRCVVKVISKHCKMAMDEHQLFETALAATMNELDLAFYLKQEQKTALECQPDTFCEFISVSWMAHLAGKVVQTLLDYVNHVHICSKLQSILEKQEEWPNICDSLRNPQPLKHQARLVIRRHMTLRRLNDPEFMSTVTFPPTLKNFLLYKEYDVYGRMDEH